MLIKWQLFPVLANIVGHKPRGLAVVFYDNILYRGFKSG